MALVAFDTLKFSQTLREKAKLTLEQAEGISTAFADATAEQLATKADLSLLATKADLSEVKAELKADITEVRAEIAEVRVEIAEVRSEITAVRTELKADIAEVRAELKAGLAETKAEILKWMFGVIGFQTFIILGAVLAMGKLLHA